MSLTKWAVVKDARGLRWTWINQQAILCSLPGKLSCTAKCWRVQNDVQWHHQCGPGALIQIHVNLTISGLPFSANQKFLHNVHLVRFHALFIYLPHFASHHFSFPPWLASFSKHAAYRLWCRSSQSWLTTLLRHFGRTACMPQQITLSRSWLKLLLTATRPLPSLFLSVIPLHVSILSVYVSPTAREKFCHLVNCIVWSGTSPCLGYLREITHSYYHYHSIGGQILGK